MGYTTDFTGSLSITPALTEAQVAYINKFNGTRRMKRNPEIASTLPDPIREAVGLPIGEEGCYFVGGGEFAGQAHDASVTNYNSPPAGQPALWCQWCIVDGKLQWDQGEKFYGYGEWLEYLIDTFFAPWGVILNGEIQWQGEDRDDMGTIYAKDNKVALVVSTIVNERPTGW